MTRSSRFSTVLVLVCAATTLLAHPVAGTTYVMMSDEDLADQAPVIAEVDILLSFNVPTRQAPKTGYTAIVIRALKGVIDSSTIDIHVIGGIAPDGMELWVPGVPRFASGEKALLFLYPNATGSYDVLHWQLGAFRLFDTEQGRFVVRDLADAYVIADKKAPDEHLARDYEAFATWLIDRAGGLHREPDYFRRVSHLAIAEKYALFSYRGKNLRWFDFDQGRSVNWRFRSAGSQGTLSSFKTAVPAWNWDSASNVRYIYGGTTGSSRGHTRADGVNSIIFGDPNREIPGRFSCQRGGTLAAGGPWFRTNTTSRFRGKSYYRIVEGDIIVNDGAECYIRSSTARARMVFAHELGHTLGIDHSTNRRALMYPSGHDNGSNLHADDRRALRSLYQGGGGSGGGGGGGGGQASNLAAPTNLTAKATSSTEAVLTWRDNSTNEKQFEIRISVGGSGWQTLGTYPENTTSLRLWGGTPGQSYRFFVLAKRNREYSPPSNMARLTLPRN